MLGDTDLVTRGVGASSAASAASTASPWPPVDVVVVERDDGAPSRPRPARRRRRRAARAARRGRPRPRRRRAASAACQPAATITGPAATNRTSPAGRSDCPAPGDELLDRGRLEAERPRHADEAEVDRAAARRAPPSRTRRARLVLARTARSAPSRAPRRARRCRAPTGASGRARRGRGPASEPDVDHLRAARSRCCRSARSAAWRGSRRTSGTTGSSPASAIAPACETMSCSAMPHSKKRSGKRSRNATRPQSERRSASSATSRGSCSAGGDQRLAVGAARAAGAPSAPSGARAAPPRTSSTGPAPSRSSRSFSRATQLLDRPLVLVRRSARPSGSRRARCRSSAGRCGSMNETPPPLRVSRDRRACGRSSPSQAPPASRANARRSWPSQRATAQPNARELRLEVAEVADLRRPTCPTGPCCGRRSR